MRSGGVIVLSCINGFIEEFPFFFPAELILGSCGSGGGGEPAEKVLRPIQTRLES
jgi:hypothetical protein